MKTQRNILIAFILNLGFAVLEFFGGVLTNSVAILSDSVHDLGDALSVGLSYFLERKSKRGADKRHSYGYLRYSVLGSVITTTVLSVSSVLVIIGAMQRIINPVEVDYSGMIILALVGVVLNTIAAVATHDEGSLNQRAINLHMLEDVLGWIVVLVGAIIMQFTDISVIDPLMSIGVALFVLLSALRNLHAIIDIFLEKTPAGIDLDELRSAVCKLEGVADVHHIHVRSVDGYNNYATLHAVVKNYDHTLKEEIKERLGELGICHSTVELEICGEDCADACCAMAKTASTNSGHGHGHDHGHKHSRAH